MSEKKKTLGYRIGLVLLVLAVICWVFILVVPFFPLSAGQKTGMITGCLIVGEALFWIGTALVGKELVTKYKAYFNPKNWFKKKETETNDFAKENNKQE